MNTLAQVLLVATAAWQVVEIVRHGSIFARFRERVRFREDFWSDLLACGFCFSVWVAGLTDLFVTLAVSLSMPSDLKAAFCYAALWPVRTFAASRLANLGNDLTHAWCRTPGTKKDIARTFSQGTLHGKPDADFAVGEDPPVR